MDKTILSLGLLLVLISELQLTYNSAVSWVGLGRNPNILSILFSALIGLIGVTATIYGAASD